MADSRVSRPDDKELAARTFAEVVERTRDFFPEEKYRPRPILERAVNAQFGLQTHGHEVYGNSDGIGTKPEVAERLFTQTKDYRWFETIAHDGVAMVADDSARYGYFVLGLLNSIDVNSADDPRFIQHLAKGMEVACRAGQFPLLNGETAELGYRSPGVGDARVNWNMAALTLINREKIIDGTKLRPGQPVVALREKSIRSNGLTRARAILENAYMQDVVKCNTKKDWIVRSILDKLDDLRILTEDFDLFRRHVHVEEIISATPVGEQIWEQIHLPWHEEFPDEAEALLQPSTIYAPLIYAAQGGVDGKVVVPLTGCAHISGGGVPLKGKRMVEPFGLGLQLEAIFPDPEIVTSLIQLAKDFPHPEKGPLVDERTACEQWNRGVGFLCATPDSTSANTLILMARQMGYEAGVAGKITDRKKVEWRGQAWEY